MLPKPRKKVHFVFKSHHPNEPYALPGMPFPETKTAIFEASSGVLRGKSKHYVRTLSKATRGKQLPRNVAEMLEHLGKFLSNGKRVIAGESGKPLQFVKLKGLDARLDGVEARFRSNPSFENYVKSLAVNARHMRYRHALIRNTVRRQLKNGTPLVANYGYVHSLLSSELRARGIESSRAVGAREFNPHETLLRKLVRGKKVQDISQKELQEGYLSELLFTPLAHQMFGPNGITNDAEMRLHSVAMHALLRGISPTERVMLVLSPELDSLLHVNGIVSVEDASFQKTLLKNSPFLRRMMGRQQR